jgi:hypothetical protein
VAQVKAVACEPPSQGTPLSRRSCADIHRLVIERGISAASAPTIARWLREDAIRPWRYRSWIFPTDPDFLQKAGPVLDLSLRAASRASCCTPASSSSRPTKRLQRSGELRVRAVVS